MIMHDDWPDEKRESPALLTWEDIETAVAGQLNLPGFSVTPPLAERAFLVLARNWAAQYKEQGNPARMTRELRAIELACLLLSVEWGREFTVVATRQTEKNRAIAARHRECSWHCTISWRLCEAARLLNPENTIVANELLVNLDHGKSDIRCWMMELAWVVRDWLPFGEVMERLLDNIASTLAGSEMAVGLARMLCMSDQVLEANIQTFHTDPVYAQQFENRVARAKELGYANFEKSFWETEAICRRLVEKAILGDRYAGPPSHRQNEPFVGEKESDFQNMLLDPGRPFLEQFEERAAEDEECRAWLEKDVYTNLDLMQDLDPVSVAIAKGLARSKR
jgi:hypothetical protein